MNPQLILILLAHNSADIKEIVDTIGIDNLFKLAPHLLAIVDTINKNKAQ